MTAVVGVVFLATLAAIHWIHTRRHHRTTHDTETIRADFDREWDRIVERNGFLVQQNWVLRRLLAEQCQHTREWKAIAYTEFRRVAELNAEVEALRTDAETRTFNTAVAKFIAGDTQPTRPTTRKKATP